MLEQSGFVEVGIGDPVDTFGGAGGETNARAYQVFGYPFLARKPRRHDERTRHRRPGRRGTGQQLLPGGPRRRARPGRRPGPRAGAYLAEAERRGLRIA